jgi:hypothetical protein
MQQHEMDNTVPHPLVSAQSHGGQSEVARGRVGGISRLIGCIALVLLGGLSLGGPTSTRITGKAEAQVLPGGLSGKRIETFVIDPASFSMVTSAEPNIETAEGTTTYILTSRGSVTFTPMDGAQRTMTLNASDRVIERPFAGTVTVVRSR